VEELDQFFPMFLIEELAGKSGVVRLCLGLATSEKTGNQQVRESGRRIDLFPRRTGPGY
jgi:hypothetical protein